MVQDINWNNFIAKFNGKEDKAFEHLCYLLFCKEYGKDTGVFRFKNHAGVETDPIETDHTPLEKDNQIIGWQSKFYDASLSKHKSDLIKSIDTAKKGHPNLTKFLLYTNQEFGQNRNKKTPKSKLDIEAHAKKNGIEIEWRGPSYFEAPFVCEENYSIAEHFFSLKKGVIDSIQELNLHAQSVLKSVRSQISFNEKIIKINRSGITEILLQENAVSSLFVISGQAGAGKTAIIKDVHEACKDSFPLYIFRGAEFKDVSHINQLFKNYGEISEKLFIDEHEDFKQKFIIIDSSEVLGDIENQEIFGDFLTNLTEKGWTVILTVRFSYLDQLQLFLREVYRIKFTNLNIPALTNRELNEISGSHNFKLPSNERLLNMLSSPLYLDEYLKNYAATGAALGYSDFRDNIWKRYIQDITKQSNNIHRRREKTFLALVQTRVNEGGLFIDADNLDEKALHKLETDEIIRFDSSVGKYFITHDIYEEWGLEKLISHTIASTSDFATFFERIGSSFPMRRALRKWLSDRLFENEEIANQLIEYSTTNKDLDQYWQDEILVAVLLSDYSITFFNHFEDELLKIAITEDNSLLRRILFLLQIACKHLDEELLRILNINYSEEIAFSTAYSIPLGSGWDTTINFLNKHKQRLAISSLYIVLPILEVWTSKHRQGPVTKAASQLALFYYQELASQEYSHLSSKSERTDRLLKVILNGAGEIKDELETIFDEVISKKDTSHLSKHYALAQLALSSAGDSAEVAKNLPDKVIELAKLFWLQLDREDQSFLRHGLDIEQDFGLSERHFDYYPPSAFQTPVFILLREHLPEAINFILSFTNNSIEYFSKSELGKEEVKEIDVVINESGETVKQFISTRIWNIYRGSQVAPSLLESMHMALERWLLKLAVLGDAKDIERWCLYLIRKSRSASITAIIVSFVLANPEKLFPVAIVLFRTKEFFLFDTSRMQLDANLESIYGMYHDQTGFYKKERLATLKDSHRSYSLEQLALNYQVLNYTPEKQELFKERQECISKIWDIHYKQLQAVDAEKDLDRTWRLYLARMDIRKMKVKSEIKDNKTLISFIPKIDPELKKFSEDSLSKSSEAMKYLPLKLWANYRYERNNDEYQKYPIYNNDPKLVISETKIILEALSNGSHQNKDFILFYYAVPAYTCAVLLRDFISSLDDEEIKLCKDTLLSYVIDSLSDSYLYQISDGVDSAIGTLPLLMPLFPEEAEDMKILIFFATFDRHPIGMHQRFSDYAIRAVMFSLWQSNTKSANAILMGILALKTQYNTTWDHIRSEMFKEGVYKVSKERVLETFCRDFEPVLDKVKNNTICYKDIGEIEKKDFDTLLTAVQLLPVNISDEAHKLFLKEVLPIFSKKIFNDSSTQREDEESFNYTGRHRFLEKFTYIILSLEVNDIEEYLTPFITTFHSARDVSDMFQAFINAEDRLEKYDQFWTVWKLFLPKVSQLSKKPGFYNDSIIRSYLFAESFWQEGIEGWHTLKDREKSFFKKVSEDMGASPNTIYSLSKFLNEIGASFVEDGIIWISEILKNNSHLYNDDLVTNTTYYLEKLLRTFCVKNKHKVRTNLRLKTHILVILDFLINKGSVTSYMLRDAIL